ncbi:hypothetical Protein YC6258_03606 [Gynuella sunshinyii YC6258]|uniref:Uncharacterized protein n=1 Tax=Gynuella sunshinyii YC6258 TaxID=1445510 RepID=A0A0C5VLP4_9GAMM|nr:hypothetical Protein YC6258_03606 [Gynuella sunshinyii YC6258]
MIPSALNNHDFLSCLCGSELESGLAVRLDNFLSCLCGSEPLQRGHVSSHLFLSCLCGSEPPVPAATR